MRQGRNNCISMRSVGSLRRLIRLFVFFIGFSFSSLALSANAPVTTSNTSSSVSQETLQAKINEVEASTTLDAKMRASLVEQYRKTLSLLESKRSNSTAAQVFVQARKTAGDRAKKIRKALEIKKTPVTLKTLNVSGQSSLSEVEQQTLKEKANLAAMEAKFSDIKQQLTHEAERSTPAGQRLSEAKARLEEIAAELSAPAVEGEDPRYREAYRWTLQAQADALRSEIHMLDEELLSQPMRIELLEAQRDEAQRSIKRATTRIRLLTDLLHDRQRSQAELAAEKAAGEEIEAMGKHPLVLELAEKNARLSAVLSNLVDELAGVSAGSDVTSSEVKRIADEFLLAKQKLKIVGVSQVIGQVLLEQRRALPDVALFDAETRRQEGLIADASLRQIQFEEEQKALKNPDTYINSLTGQLPQAEIDDIRADLQGLVESRRTLMKKALSLNKSLLRALGEYDTGRQELIKVVGEYDDFLAERLLWIRSAPPLSLSLLKTIPAQIAVLLSFENWLEAGDVLLSRLTDSPLFVLILLISAVLFLKNRSMCRWINATARLANDPLQGHISDTLKALGLTLLVAANWPLLFVVMGWQLEESLASTQFTHALSAALLKLSLIFFFLRTFYVLMTPGGVATAHFNWPKLSVAHLRQGLFRFMAIFLPLVFITVFISNYDAQALGKGLGRMGLIFALALLSLAIYRLFGFLSDMFTGVQGRAGSSRLMRLRYLWLLIGVLLPLFLAGVASMGYMYTAGTLAGRLLSTLWLASGLFIFQQLAVRWLSMTQHRIKYQALLDQRAEMPKTQNEDQDDFNTVPSMSVEEPTVDWLTLDQESRKLLSVVMAIFGLTGLWLIWADVLPAFGILDKITLWHTMGSVDGVEQLIPVTFADLGISLLIAVMTIVAVRSLPALIELVLMQRFRLQAGSSYAAKTLTRYVIATVGALAALGALGASWAQVQWLVAALGVGIGFGLQEIVANFISGLIILFERPIRVGDVVTVGTTTGTVTRIQIRATTILTYDRQELLVPNKEFITGRLLNWSLSDQVTRVNVPVGVAYGCDVDKAMAIIEAAARSNERVLETPEPFVTFEEFGDNSLLLKLRCYLGSVDHRLSVISELHSKINHDLAAADISIAFPQRDLHLDTDAPLDIRIHQADTPPQMAS